ncbi:hypothetical protein Hoch_6502 [Haliangium ochraceum DSM 14365]|uniref:Uncharacterized protein n=1 Tax=Haliangium ochraceum (strain DSM 14365 / JCM 11303 / SMP-2) TaxID=502025 RepID=D0LQG2_HALO1|nr:hypothetical protein Hoch_6502 [Haliangium ochraceum DSM 14365]
MCYQVAVCERTYRHRHTGAIQLSGSYPANKINNNDYKNGYLT